MPHGWIADEKFKVFTGSRTLNIPNSRYIAVWLDVKVGCETRFNKAQMDIMNHVAKRQDDLVFSCAIYPDDKTKLSIHLFHLQSDQGWKQIGHFYYSSTTDFSGLSPFERGQIGESLGSIFTARLLHENRSDFFPELNAELFFIDECVVPRENVKLSYSLERWIPDAIFQVFSNPNPTKLNYEYNPKKVVYIEVKTGKYAKFERWQMDDILLYSKSPNSIIFYCEILPNASKDSINITVKQLIDSQWKTVGIFNYADFPFT
jgi:hypothetical protein